MRKKTAAILGLVLIFVIEGLGATAPPSVFKTDIVSVSIEKQHDFVNPSGESALAIRFQLKKDWHFYASAKTAPSGMNLKIKPSTEGFIAFSEPIFPPWQMYFDESSGQKLEVFSDNFTVHLPFKVADIKTASSEDIIEIIKIDFEGPVCSGLQCTLSKGQLGTGIKIAFDSAMGEPKFALPKALPQSESPPTVSALSYSVWFALGLAFLAGLSLNIMPCVWPVLPIIIMRIVEQAKQTKGKSTALGLAFCFGILLFFACLAGANIILQLAYGTVMQWGDQFRNPAFVAGLALLLVVLALFMFGLFTVSLPSAIAGKSGSGKGFAGSVGMGFLAAILSTPCSFAILAAAFAWAQAQPLLLGTIAIMVIGLGMATPYVILTSMPGLLKKIPKPGQWMELFKQTIGFVLLVIAVKLIAALPQVRRMNVLYFAVVLGFCVWMWGTWVSYNTKPVRKWLVRIIAVVLAITAGSIFLPAPAAELIDWQQYDASLIETAVTQNRPVLIKFYADWCLTCMVIDKIVYHREDVAELIKEKNVLAIKADTTTDEHPATEALEKVYNEPVVPVSILLIPGKEEPVRWHEIYFADELKTTLENLNSQ